MSKDYLYCSFCGKKQDEVKKLIAGPTVYICDECVMLCVEIIGENGAPNALDLINNAKRIWEGCALTGNELIWRAFRIELPPDARNMTPVDVGRRLYAVVWAASNKVATESQKNEKLDRLEHQIRTLEDSLEKEQQSILSRADADIASIKTRVSNEIAVLRAQKAALSECVA